MIALGNKQSLFARWFVLGKGRTRRACEAWQASSEFVGTAYTILDVCNGEPNAGLRVILANYFWMSERR